MTGEANSVRIGNCRLLLSERVLLAGGKPVRIGSRALDLLVRLVQTPGQTVSPDELMHAAWPNSIVEGNTLRVQIRNMRKVLSAHDADCYVVNRSGRGYAFIDPAQSAAPRAPAQGYRAVPTVGRLIGRDEVIGAISATLQDHRLVTLTGAGGIGKTAVAMEVGRRRSRTGSGEVHYVDFSSLRDERLVPSMLASALGLAVSDRSPFDAIAHHLAGAPALLILDTCEHVIEAMAMLVSGLLADTERLDILTTSREVLRVEGEWVHRLQPLRFPQDEPASLENAGAYTAIDLFREKASAAGFTLPDDAGSHAMVGKICARLDGLPLAIELAAARVEQFGIGGLLNGLDRHPGLLTDGLRNGSPRQRTMRSALDWSYDLLPHKEQMLLNRLSTFQSAFTAEAAMAVAATGGLDEQDVLDGLGHLYRKSLLSLRQVHEHQGYRLLDTTRAYAAERLISSGEESAVRRRHALHVGSQLQSERAARSGNGSVLYDDSYLQEVRGALDWAFSVDGNLDLACELTLAAVPAWFARSMIDECRRRVEQAISKLRRGGGSDWKSMQLHAALGSAYMNIEGAGTNTRSAWLKVLRLSGQLGSIDYRQRALWGLWVDTRNRGRYDQAVQLSRRFDRLAARSGDSRVRRNASRMQGISHFFVGNLALSRQFVERVLASDRDPGDIATYQFDQWISSRCFLAQILWLQGFPDQAIAMASRNVEDAMAINHPGTISYALTEGACPVAWNVGDLAALRRFARLVVERTAAKGLEVWRTIGECYDGIEKLDRGSDDGLAILAGALSHLRTECLGPVFTRALAHYAAALVQRRRWSEATATVEEAVQRARVSCEHWCLPELLRVKAFVIQSDNASAAMALLEESLAMAEAQGALGWQLRSATSLAELLYRRGEGAKAHDVLHPVYHRFDEGFATRDLRQAAQLLRRLPPSPQPSQPERNGVAHPSHTSLRRSLDLK